MAVNLFTYVPYIYAADTADSAQEASGGLPQFDISTWAGQVFWLAITFAVLYFLLARFILPKIREGLTERGDRIADDLDAASRMQQEAKQAELDYERALADAKAKAHNIAETTRKSLDTEIERDFQAAESEFEKKQAEADARILTIRRAALAHIDTVAHDTIGDIVETVSGIKPGAAKIKSALKMANDTAYKLGS